MRPASEAVLRMCPERCALITGYAALTPLTTPRRFTSMARCQCRSSSSSSRPPIATPALLTMTSRRPCASTVSRTRARTASASATSTTAAEARGPSSPATAWALATSRSAMTTELPRATSSAAMARPMPDPAPVTIETRGSKLLRAMGFPSAGRRVPQTGRGVRGDGLRGWGPVRCGHRLEDTVVHPAGAPPVGHGRSGPDRGVVAEPVEVPAPAARGPDRVPAAPEHLGGEPRLRPGARVAGPGPGPVEALEDVAGGELDHEDDRVVAEPGVGTEQEVELGEARDGDAQVGAHPGGPRLGERLPSTPTEVDALERPAEVEAR